MGEHAVRRIKSDAERMLFIKHLLADLDTYDRLLEEGRFESGVSRIGAEQEFCLVNRNWEPDPIGAEILEAMDDPHLTTELAQYDLELNLDPELLKGDCLSVMHRKLQELMTRCEKVAATHGAEVILTGILPTITPRHIDLDLMTISERFKALDEAMREHKGGDFELHITGVDELIAKHDTIVFEACNTSFQCHLQIDPKDGVDLYNWSQMIAAPVLACSVNSPLLLGKELWAETRIALFQQSIDVRNSSTLIREQQPRVTFGTRWLKESTSEIYKEDIARFEMLLTADLGERTSLEQLEQGSIPALRALSLHNGTIYRWNRLCFGTSGTPHLRIECRYIPSGPTILDEIANLAFWVGLMKAMGPEHRQIWKQMPFRQVKANFLRAAVSGIETKLDWFGQVKDTRELILQDLIPMAEAGLKKSGVSPEDIRKYIGVIKQRIASHNGAQWSVHAYRALRVGAQKDIALRRMTALMHRNQRSGLPVGEWPKADPAQLVGDELKLEKIYQVMVTDLFTVSPDDPIDLVRRFMSWRSMHHVPVEDVHGKLLGLVTKKDIERARARKRDLSRVPVSRVMKAELMTADPNDLISEVVPRMHELGYGCVPVVHAGILVGLVTRTDLARLMN